MNKLAPNLEVQLSLWRAQTAVPDASAAKRAKEISISSSMNAEKRRVMIGVTHNGDVAALREAGMDTGIDRNGLVSGSIALEDLERLAAVPSVIRIEKIPEAHPTLDGTVTELRVPWKVPPTTPWPGRGAGVIVAIVDTGIDIFHDSFKKTASTTRILELWDQSATIGGSAPPSPFQQIGRIYSREDIENGLTAGPPFHSIDKNGHGTHVAGIAAGNGSQDDRCSNPGKYVGVAPEADLVIVKAISLSDGSQSNVDDALEWCAQAGARHSINGKNKPVVINCSFGTTTGPHDGTAWRDRTVDRILRPVAAPVPTGLAIVCAAGNDGSNEIHENGTIAASESATIPFRIPWGSRQEDSLDIWYNGEATLDLTLVAPPSSNQQGPNKIGPIAPSASGSFAIGGMTIAVDSSTAPETTNNNQKQIRVDIQVTTAGTQLSSAIDDEVTTISVSSAAGFPTSGRYTIAIGAEKLIVKGGQGTTTWTVKRGAKNTSAAAHPSNADIEQVSDVVIRPGQWEITLTETAGADAKWRAWFGTNPRGDAHPTFRLDPKAANIVERRRFDTINSPGSATTAITVANYSEENGEIWPSSSRGLQTPPTVPEWTPNFVYFVGEEVIPAGTPTGYRYRCLVAGTSGSTEPNWPTTVGDSVSDGDPATIVLWTTEEALVHEFKPTIAATGAMVAAPRSRDDKPAPSSCCDQMVVNKSGTSMAAPHITGLVALMLEKNPNLTFEQIRSHLQRTTRIEGIPDTEVPPIFDNELNIRAGSIWGSGKADAAAVLADVPAVQVGGGGGGTFSVDELEWGYTPHTVFSRLGEWQSRFGPRPGLMLMAALISEHFDQVLRLVNTNSKVGAVWRRQGGPLLVRHLLVHQPVDLTVLPAFIDGYDVGVLLKRILWLLKRYGTSTLQMDIDRYSSFVQSWPGGNLQRLDRQALELARSQT